MHKKGLVTAIILAMSGVACDHHGAGLTDSGACPDGGIGDGDSGSDAGPSDGGCFPPEPNGCFFGPGEEVWVDGYGGTDSSACCCGTPEFPCQTLTHVMAIASDGGTVGIQIRAFLSNGGVVWPAAESWPIHFGLGVTVTAPDIYFAPPPAPENSNAWGAFWVYPYSSSDVYAVTFQGDPADPDRPIRIGLPIDAGLNSVSSATIAISDPPPHTWNRGLSLNLNNVWVQGEVVAISVDGDALLTLGPLPIHIGSNNGLYPVNDDNVGIDCYFATVRDIGSYVVQIDSQATDIFAHYGCDLTLTQGPSLGLRPDGGFRSCPAKLDTYGLGAVGAAVVTLGSLDEPAELHCFTQDAIYTMQNDTGLDLPIGNPTVMVVANESNANCGGAYLSAGSFAAVASSFSYNMFGIWVADTGSAILDTQDFAYFNSRQPTQISCNGLQEYGPPSNCTEPGINAPFNVNVAISDAVDSVEMNDVAWNHWDSDAGVPQQWVCLDSSYQQCNCSGPDCPSTDGGFLSLRDYSNVDVVYSGAGADAGTFAFTSGFEGVCQ
jgi:hypothetical protein